MHHLAYNGDLVRPGVALKMGRRLSIRVNIRGRDHEGRRSEKISPARDPMKVAQYEVLGSLF